MNRLFVKIKFLTF